MAKTEGKELMVPITATAIELYEGGVLELALTEIEKKARVLVPDVTTKKGRDAIRSNAALVTGSKTYLFKLGKDLTEDHRAKVKSTNDVRNKMEERLNALKDEVRKPLTEYEDAEKARLCEIELVFERIKSFSSAPVDHGSIAITYQLQQLREIIVDDSFGDLENSASIEKEKAINKLAEQLELVEKREADEKELELLRTAAAEREEKELQDREKQERIDREEQIRKDAAATAQREATEKQERLDRERDEKVEQDRRDQEKRDQQAKDREAQLLKDKEDAERRVEMAALQERQRIEREQEQERLAAEKREANKKHCAKVNNDAVADLMKHAGLSKENAKAAITAIAKGQVDHTSIQY